MDLTLREDKDIIESIYPEYQRGFMNARYDQQVTKNSRICVSTAWCNLWEKLSATQSFCGVHLRWGLHDKPWALLFSNAWTDRGGDSCVSSFLHLCLSVCLSLSLSLSKPSPVF